MDRRRGRDEAPVVVVDPLKPYQKYKVVAHTEERARQSFANTWPKSQYILTASNISYVLFDREVMGEEPFEDAVAICIDGLAQKDICGGVIGKNFKFNNLASTELRTVVLAMVDIGYPRFCPIGFTLSTYKERMKRKPDKPKRKPKRKPKGGLIMHLELLCAAKQKIPGYELYIQVGDVLIYHTLRHAVEELGQDIELYAVDGKPQLVPYYSKHGFILCNKYDGCAQLSADAVRHYDSVMTEYLRKVPFTAADLEELIYRLPLNPDEVFQQNQGYYMLLCTAYRERLNLSRERSTAVFESQSKYEIGDFMVQFYKISINLARRDVELDIYRQKLQQMRK